MRRLGWSGKVLGVALVALAIAGCFETDAERSHSTTSNSGGTSSAPPRIPGGNTFSGLRLTGVPVSVAIEGSQYTFQPYAEAPSGSTISFKIVNRPTWASFDERTGRLTGRPGAADVGGHAGIEISAAAGSDVAKLGPFSISVRSSSSDDAGSTFTFADPPEISFVRGYAEHENLGIWQIDTGNFWSPGDLDNSSSWQPRVATELQILEGSLTGVTYDSATATLRYDGKGGRGWARARLTAPAKSAVSNDFYIRVLIPKAIWGQNAASRTDIASLFPDVPKFDYGTTSFAEAWDSIATTGTEHDPDFVLVLAGTYFSAVEARLTDQVDPETATPKDRINWRTNKGDGERPWFYLIGEPGMRPKFSGYDVRNGGIIAIPGFRVSVVRNIEIETMVTNTSGKGWSVGVPNRKYWSKIYAHDTYGFDRPEWPDYRSINDDVFGSHSPEGDTTDSYVRGGVPKAPNDWKSWFWNNRFLKTGGSSLKHTIYLHGRPDAWLIYNNNLHNGGNSSSAVKATVGHFRVLNSRISAFADDSNPGDPSESMNQQLIDVPSASDVVIVNNELIGGRRLVGSDVSGTRTGLIWFNPRRTLWGTDNPRYPDVTYQAAPFSAFLMPFTYSDVSHVDYPDARVEVRPRGGDWRVLAARPAPDTSGRADKWIVTVQPEDLPADGAYEMRINGGARASETYIQLTVSRNANYFAVTSFADGALSTPWYAEGPKAYLLDDGAAYWTAMKNWGGTGQDGRADPTNPYTQKKYVAFNRFVWRVHPELDDKREEAIRDNGSYPSLALYTGSSGSRLGAVPHTWADPGVTFLLNNEYSGWRVEDMGTEFWMRTDVDAITRNPANELYGPGQDDPGKANWPHYSSPMAVERQPLIFPIGGERTPASPAEGAVAVPPWFKLF